MPTYKYNDTVTLTAKDTECCVFDYWALSDDPCKPVSYDNPLVINATSNASYIAKFKKKKFTVNVSTSYPSIVIIEGNGVYNCGENVMITATYPNCLDIYWSDSSLTPETSYYQHGDTVTLTYKIDLISSDFYGTLIGDVLTAHVTVSPCPSDGGDVGIVYFPSLQNNTLSCNSQSQQQWSICEHSENGCSVGTEGDFMCGDVITLIARPNTNDRYVFNGWSTGECKNNCNGNYISTNPIYTINACSDTDYIACFSNEEPPVVNCLSLRVLIDKNVVVNNFCYIAEINCGEGNTKFISLQTDNVLHFQSGCNITIHTYYEYKEGQAPEAPQISIDGVVLSASYVSYGVLFTENNGCCIPTHADLKACIHGVYNLGSVTNNVTGNAYSFIDTSWLPTDTAVPPFFDSNNDYKGDIFCDVFEKEYIGCYQDNVYPE